MKPMKPSAMPLSVERGARKVECGWQEEEEEEEGAADMKKVTGWKGPLQLLAVKGSNI